MSVNGEDQSYQFDETSEDVELNETQRSSNGAGDTSSEDPELEAIKARVREMEDEAEKIRAMQSEVEKQMNLGPTTVAMTEADKLEADARSIWIGNVDYGTTAEELEAHFHGCGSVNRVTILCDKFSGHPKGFAYVEFANIEAIDPAMALNDSLFRGRQIKVTCKRTNKHGLTSTNRPPRGRGMRARGGGSYMHQYPSYSPRVYRGRGGYGRSRRPHYYSPY
ncbi:hypothetical protein HELRODRAFT_156918 [Helobdella robusta]|uniref:RRM domain-containing protein n=1 Tax=Helobdella robusta TaxID=6412 RepID=T1EM32_HELRO|nr:hypothetical protein HELRODRAFT_156918 [Helobdella robusta]ESO05016.1 hypothetical protein HELRODRAFT_156918 [Helobdella robusta]